LRDENFRFRLCQRPLNAVGLLNDGFPCMVDIIFIADTEPHRHPPPVVRDVVDHCRVSKVTVRDRHQLIIKCIQLGYSHLDLPDHPLVPVPFDPVADHERLILDNKHPGDKVCNEILRGESHRECNRPTQGCKRCKNGPKPGDCRSKRHGKDRCHKGGQILREPDECFIEPTPFQRLSHRPNRGESPNLVGNEKYNDERQYRRPRVDQRRDIILQVSR
jgi:hypothetical protein